MCLGFVQRTSVGNSDIELGIIRYEEVFGLGGTDLVSNPGSVPYSLWPWESDSILPSPSFLMYKMRMILNTSGIVRITGACVKSLA